MPAADLGRRQVAKRVHVDGEPCACDERGTCGLHYDELDDRQQFLARERAGAKAVARGRVTGQIGSPRRG